MSVAFDFLVGPGFLVGVWHLEHGSVWRGVHLGLRFYLGPFMLDVVNLPG